MDDGSLGDSDGSSIDGDFLFLPDPAAVAVETFLEEQLGLDVGCEINDDGYLEIDILDMDDVQARRLGEFLPGWNMHVCKMELFTSGLTATGNYQPMLDFIQNSPHLNSFEFHHNNKAASNDEQQEIARRFLDAVAGSETIQILEVTVDSANVPSEWIVDLLANNNSINDLSIQLSVDVVSVNEIEAALSRNTTVSVLRLSLENSALVTCAMKAMKIKPTIQELHLWHSHLSVRPSPHELDYSQFAQELRSVIGLRRLECAMWPASENADMMDGFKSNLSLAEVYFGDVEGTYRGDMVGLASDGERIRLAEEEVLPYLERNRGICRDIPHDLIGTQGNLPDYLIPRACAAMQDIFLQPELIYGLLKENPQVFQPRQEELS